MEKGNRPIGKLKHIKTEIDQKSDIAAYLLIFLEDEDGTQYRMRASSFLFDLKPLKGLAFDWVEKYFESKESANVCLGCERYYVEDDVNFCSCTVLDNGVDPTDCPKLPDEYYPQTTDRSIKIN